MSLIKAILQSLNPKGWKTTKLNRQAKAVLTLLIAEIQDCKDMTEVKSLIDCWIKANDLHPEEVETLSEAEFKKAFPARTIERREMEIVDCPNCKPGEACIVKMCSSYLWEEGRRVAYCIVYKCLKCGFRVKLKIPIEE